MTSRVHVLNPPLPIRPVALSAGLAVIGAGVIVAGSAAGVPVAAVVIGWIALVAAIGLIVLAWVAWRKMRVRVELDDDGYTINGPGIVEQGHWKEVTRVTQSPSSLVIHHGEQRRVQLVGLPGMGGALTALADDLAKRLDASRGYSQYL